MPLTVSFDALLVHSGYVLIKLRLVEAGNNKH